MVNKEIVERLKQLSQMAFDADEVPVGVVIVKDGKVVAEAFNQKEKDKNVLHHAEILAIDRACKRLGSWRLEGCDIFVSLSPCVMCAGAIASARIKNVFYCAENDDVLAFDVLLHNDLGTKIEAKQICDDGFCENLLKKYFENKRGNK